MFIRKRELGRILARIERLEGYLKNDYEKLNKDFKRLEKIEDALFPPKTITKNGFLPFPDVFNGLFGNAFNKPKPTYISILEERFEAAMKTLGVSVTKQSATDEKFVARKVTTLKKGKK